MDDSAPLRLTRSEQTDLISLAWHWEREYTFEVVDGAWRAILRADPAVVLTAKTAIGLREKVRADYASRRQAPTVAGAQERMST